jgi:hypothetical protein
MYGRDKKEENFYTQSSLNANSCSAKINNIIASRYAVSRCVDLADTRF